MPLGVFRANISAIVQKGSDFLYSWQTRRVVLVWRTSATIILTWGQSYVGAKKNLHSHRDRFDTDLRTCSTKNVYKN